MADEKQDSGYKRWDPDEILTLMPSEVALSDGDAKKAAERIFQENLPGAAQSIVHLAIYSANETTRLKAAQYVVDRNMGRPQDGKPLSEDDMLAKLYESVMKDAANVISNGPVEEG